MKRYLLFAGGERGAAFMGSLGHRPPTEEQTALPDLHGEYGSVTAAIRAPLAEGTRWGQLFDALKGRVAWLWTPAEGWRKVPHTR